MGTWNGAFEQILIPNFNTKLSMKANDFLTVWRITPRIFQKCKIWSEPSLRNTETVCLELPCIIINSTRKWLWILTLLCVSMAQLPSRWRYTLFNYSYVHEKYLILYKVNVKVVLNLTITTVSATKFDTFLEAISVPLLLLLLLLLLLKCLTQCWTFKKGLTSNKLIFPLSKFYLFTNWSTSEVF